MLFLKDQMLIQLKNQCTRANKIYHSYLLSLYSKFWNELCEKCIKYINKKQCILCPLIEREVACPLIGRGVASPLICSGVTSPLICSGVACPLGKLVGSNKPLNGDILDSRWGIIIKKVKFLKNVIDVNLELNRCKFFIKRVEDHNRYKSLKSFIKSFSENNKRYQCCKLFIKKIEMKLELNRYKSFIKKVSENYKRYVSNKFSLTKEVSVPLKHNFNKKKCKWIIKVLNIKNNIHDTVHFKGFLMYYNASYYKEKKMLSNEDLAEYKEEYNYDNLKKACVRPWCNFIYKIKKA
jgi:hypothetical protein